MSDLEDFFVFGGDKAEAPPPLPTPVTRIKRARALYDAECRAAIARSRNMLVPWFLMAQYLYYYRDDPILSDGCFDEVSRRLTSEWDMITHVHKPAASIYVEQGKPQLLPEEYPLMARGAACRLAGIGVALYGEEGEIP